MTDKQEPSYFSPEMRMRDAVRYVMMSRAGRRFVFHQLDEAGLLRTPFHADPHIHAFNTGQHNRAIAMFALIDLHCPEHFATMMKEAKEDTEYDREHQQRASSADDSASELAGDDK